MNKFIILFFLLATTLSAQPKRIPVIQVNDSLTVSLLNNFNLLKQFSTNDLSIRIIEVTNESGSAGFDNCEVTSNIYIAVSEFGEYPEQNLFLIRSLYAPKVKDIKEKNGKIILKLTYIDKKEKTLNIEISLQAIKII